MREKKKLCGVLSYNSKAQSDKEVGQIELIHCHSSAVWVSLLNRTPLKLTEVCIAAAAEATTPSAVEAGLMSQ